MAFSRARFGILKESKATKEKFLKYLYKRPLKIFFDKVGSKAKAPKWGFARGFEGSGGGATPLRAKKVFLFRHPELEKFLRFGGRFAIRKRKP